MPTATPLWLQLPDQRARVLDPHRIFFASDFSEWAEAVLPLEGKASCRRAIVGSGRRGANDLIAQWREQIIGSQ
jgi:hypothetical protein